MENFNKGNKWGWKRICEILIFFSPEKRRDFLGTLKSEDFVYPICLDDETS